MPLRSKTARVRPGATRRAKKVMKITKTVPVRKMKDTQRAQVLSVLNKVLNRKSETKYLTDYSDATYPNWQGFNSQIVGASQFEFAVPPMKQGVGDYERNGNKVTPTKLYTDLWVRLVPVAEYATNPNPVDITVVVYYGYCKKYKSCIDVNNNSIALASQVLRLGQTSAGTTLETKAFTGVMMDDTLVVNDDIWHLRKKKVRLFKAPGYLNGPTPPGIISEPCKTTHLFKLDYTGMTPASLMYNEDSDTYPSNFSPIWALGYYYNDATAPDTGAGGIIEANVMSHLSYKDM